ncbi:AMP-binding protein [Psychrobacillus sp. NPDC058041]|uniref:AMP-binding protein n=1 Tax=Psychrobacillus sp. NPDC058041 TaxID=3346310 RepID=UPI0036DD7814
MRLVKLIKVLYKIKLFSPLGLYWLIVGIYKCGINIMLLLYIAERTYGNKIALVYEEETVSYKQLLLQSEKLSFILKEKFQLKSGQKVGFLCKNHSSLVKSIFAISRLGSDIYLLNAEMSKMQFNQLVIQHNFSLIVYDFELSTFMEETQYIREKILSYHDNLPAINNLLHSKINVKYKLQKSSKSKIVLLTGGTTGKSKEVVHTPSLFNFLNPFLALLTRLNLLNCHTSYIATPIYHGYGIAILISFIALGKTVILNKGFHAEKACSLIRENNVDIVTVVPLMIHKMLKTNPADLKSLVCIASGGAELNPKLVEEVFSKLGNVLYNLYGTSEAGLNIIATPNDLKYSVYSIGKKIEGARLIILDNNKVKVTDGEIGQLCIQNKWSMTNKGKLWIETGDLGYRDNNGYYFLRGRTDDMIVSAGVNVYPIEVEQLIINHPLVEDVAVIGISDETFGQRLQAFVQPVDVHLSKEELFEWLRPRVARFQLPKDIVFVDHIPYTPVGKIDKGQLRQIKAKVAIQDYR